jgi:hypothetical protein
MAELLPISSPLAAERQLDVVFVHGLGGDPIATWRSGTDENSSWPHWLDLEFGTQIGVCSKDRKIQANAMRRFAGNSFM